jgi:hypothetical protein
MNELKTTYAALQGVDSSIWQLDAPEITIRGRRARYTTNRPTRAGFLLLDNVDWIDPESNGISLLSSVAPSRRFYYGTVCADNKYLWGI